MRPRQCWLGQNWARGPKLQHNWKELFF